MTNAWIEIDDFKHWDSVLAEKEQASFLQSSAFGKFHQSLGNKVWYLGKMKGNKLSGLCLVVKLASKTGSFLYVPGGPFIDDWEEDFPSLAKFLGQLGKDERVSFVRLDAREIGSQQLKLIEQFELKESPTYTQPQCTLILNLDKSLDELKKGLSASTRYNIGWVERQGVAVKVSEKPSDIEIFNKLLAETAARHHFRLVNKPDYYREQFLSFARADQAKLYLTYGPGKLSNEVLSAAIVIYFGKTATYLHAASSSKAPKLRAPYLMVWKAIADAQEAGFKFYDFWGVAKDESPKDPWAGVTTFKKSFGGERRCYEKPYDLVLDNKGYYFSIFGEKARNILKRLR